MIHYPNRDGISITGRVFLAELIPVEAGKSFIYYKSYQEPIELVREYYTDTRTTYSIKLSVEDSRKSKTELFTRSRTLCLYDNDNKIIPFSRKFVDEDFNNFIEILGISSDIDYNYITNDINGCIVFDPKYIDNNNFDKVPIKVCDLFSGDSSSFISNVDKSKMFFEKGSSDPQQRKKIIIIVVVVIVVVLVVIALIITFCVIKRKRAKRNDESTEQNTELDNIENKTNP